MKKLFLILVFSLVLGDCGWVSRKFSGKQEFVNPIFNGTLWAYSRTSWNTRLTFNSISVTPDDFSSPDAYIEKYDCKLLENESDHIKYFCNVCHPAILDANKLSCALRVIVYEIDGDFIRVKYFDPGKREPFGSETLTVKPF